jgi:hypothetical protein
MAIPTLFEGPVPGQSLTDEPKNAPWENPAMYADPLDALEFYMKKLGDVEAQEELIDTLDIGVPISIVADSMLSNGVMNGIHSVDTKLILKPYIALQVKAIADVVGVDYKETMLDYKDKDEAAQEKRMRTLAAKLKVQVGLGKKQDAEDPGVILQEQVVEELSTDAEVDTTEDSFSDVLESAPTEGLMSRED